METTMDAKNKELRIAIPSANGKLSIENLVDDYIAGTLQVGENICDH